MFGITSMGAPNYFHQCKGIYDDLEEEEQAFQQQEEEEIVEYEVFKLSKPQSTLSAELRSINSNHNNNNTTTLSSTLNNSLNNTTTATPTGHTRQPQSTIANKYISPLYQSAISKKPNKNTLVKEIPKHKVDSLLQSTIEVKSITNLKEQQSKHIRYNLDPREKYKYPVTSNQEFGWLTSTPSNTLNKDNEKFEQTFNNMSHATRELKYNQTNSRENRKFNFPCSHTDIVKYRNNMILNNHF